MVDNTQKANSKKLNARERRDKALEARKAGYTYQAIGDLLGITKGAAHKTIMVALTEIDEKIAESADAVRTIELERLDKLYSVMYVQALKGNQGAVDRCLRIMDRRAKYRGLDAPKAIDVTSGGEIIKGYVNVSPADWSKDDTNDG